MAVRVRGKNGIQVQKIDDQGRIHVVADLISDAKTDITANMHIVGVPDGAILELGTNVITTDGDVGMIKSTGEWNWVGEEES